MTIADVQLFTMDGVALSGILWVAILATIKTNMIRVSMRLRPPSTQYRADSPPPPPAPLPLPSPWRVGTPDSERDITVQFSDQEHSDSELVSDATDVHRERQGTNHESEELGSEAPPPAEEQSDDEWSRPDWDAEAASVKGGAFWENSPSHPTEPEPLIEHEPEPVPEPVAEEQEEGSDWGFSSIWGGGRNKRKDKNADPESPLPTVPESIPGVDEDSDWADDGPSNELVHKAVSDHRLQDRRSYNMTTSTGAASTIV
jgi:hypothetical protein